MGGGAEAILKDGGTRIRVRRAGMLQFVIFKVRRVKLGSGEYAELHTDRVIDAGELQRLANETGLPVDANGMKAFPDGMGASDFLGL